MTILSRILCLVIGYAFGIFQSAYIIGRAKGIDIRKVGSGNSGTTNALRTLVWEPKWASSYLPLIS